MLGPNGFRRRGGAASDEVLAGMLDFVRAAIVRKAAGLTEAAGPAGPGAAVDADPGRSCSST